MAVTVVVGMQWGDEAKGKIVDALAGSTSQMVLRVSGGSNAGHTVYAKGQKYAFHLIPSGILYPHLECILTSNVVLNLQKVLDEIEGLQKQGVNFDNLSIDPNCHVVLPVHQMIDRRDGGKIGTTGQGIGPTYSDKTARIGIRVKDLLNEQGHQGLKENNYSLLKNKYEFLCLENGTSFDKMWQEQQQLAIKLKPYIRESFWRIQEARASGKNILVEGAQGALLDLHYGEYPFLTSSSTVSTAACIGTGLGPRFIDRVIGVAKSYSTRVGGGPMPTELLGSPEEEKLGNRIREIGKEYGTTTGRPRRIGWLDLVALRYATLINSTSEVALTLLDVLSEFDTLQVCTQYRNKKTGELSSNYPYGKIFESVNGDDFEAVYETLKGWKTDITKITSYNELPKEAKNYIEFVAKKIECPVTYVSVGPLREQLIPNITRG